MSGKATRRSWHYQPKDGPREITLLRRHWEIGDAETLKGIAYVFGEDDTNAALIVRAVNAYDELRDCLQAFVTFHGGHVLPPELQVVQAAARRVLEKVEGAI